MNLAEITRGCALIGGLATTFAAAAAGGPPVGTFNYIIRGQKCVLGKCTTSDGPGRLQIFKSGKILFFSVAPGGKDFRDGGTLLQLGRTVNLAEHGRVQRAVAGGPTMLSGSGTAEYDGQRLVATVDRVDSRPINGGTATMTSHITNVYIFDPATEKLRNGSGQLSGTVQGRRADGQPISGTISASGTFEAR